MSMNNFSANNTFPSAIRDLLLSLVDAFRSILIGNLVGLYLHGSLAMGCFNPVTSDIDFIVVVNHPLSLEIKRKLAGLCLELAKEAQSNGLEFSIVLLSATRHFTYPTPFEFHYSKAWHECYRTGNVDFETQVDDKDLAAHFTIIRHRGIALYGTSIEEVFSEVPARDYLDSIAEDANWSYQNIMSGSDVDQCTVPTYAVLNFCRVLAFINQGAILSKLEGGQWGLENLPSTYQSVIQAALDQYTTNTSLFINSRLLKQFANHAITVIDQSNSTPPAATFLI